METHRTSSGRSVGCWIGWLSNDLVPLLVGRKVTKRLRRPYWSILSVNLHLEADGFDT